MIRRLFTIMTILLALQLMSCIKEEVFEIIGIHLVAVNKDWNEVQELNLTTGFRFEINTDEKLISQFNLPTLIHECYAQFDPDRYVSYPIDTSSFILVLDQEITIQDDTISADSNLFSVPTFRSNIEYLQNSRNGTTLFWLEDSVISIVSAQGDFRISFECLTTDGKLLQDELEVSLNY